MSLLLAPLSSRPRKAMFFLFFFFIVFFLLLAALKRFRDAFCVAIRPLQG